MLTCSAIIAVLSLIGWIYLAVFNGFFWLPLLAEAQPEPDAWPSVDIIIPARNEANILPRCLPSLLAQDYPGAWRVLLVDDHSEDGTRDVALRLATTQNKTDRLAIVTAPDLPQGWSGKVAAMQAGVTQSSADYILFTDADIEHNHGSLRQLISRALYKKLDLTSLMVKLHCRTAAEKLMVPAFVFFFAMLYPFRRAGDPDSKIAAAAGGVVLLRRRALDNIGGLNSIHDALIDDCALAKAIKQNGGDNQTPGRIELTLTHQVKSLRLYPQIWDVWQMVARTAFTQLCYSPLLLAGTVFGMGLLFFSPILFAFSGNIIAVLSALLADIIMIMIYVPMVRFYGLPGIWAFTLPFAALFYIGATIDSARLYWQNKGGQWKGRSQA
jgi:hopene-associated glycosyltransferase HpnB